MGKQQKAHHCCSFDNFGGEIHLIEKISPNVGMTKKMIESVAGTEVKG